MALDLRAYVLYLQMLIHNRSKFVTLMTLFPVVQI